MTWGESAAGSAGTSRKARKFSREVTFFKGERGLRGWMKWTLRLQGRRHT
jgi:hypothetical protein